MEDALRQVAQAMQGVSTEPISISHVELHLSMPLRRVLDGYVTEKVAANEVARKLLDAVTSRLPPSVSEDVKQRRAYFLFGRHIPDSPKSLEQLLAERLDMAHYPDATKSQWLQKAIDQMSKMGVTEYQQLVQARDTAAIAWLFGQGPNPQENPVDKGNLNDDYKPYAKKAQKHIKEIFKNCSSGREFHDELIKQYRALRATGDEGDSMVSLLIKHFLSTMLDRAKGEIYAKDPSLANVDQKWVAARLMMSSHLDAMPYVKLPDGVPPLTDLPEELLKKYRKKSEKAVQIARNVVGAARAGGSGDPSGQYYYVQMQQARLRRSSKPEEALASVILARYLQQQKKPWARKHIEGILKHKPSRKPSWSLTDDVAYAGREDEKLPPDHRQVKKVQEAWDQIQQIMDPDVLDRIGPCKVRVHGFWKADLPVPVFRAHYSGSKREIHVHRFESLPILMHEFGHHVEDQGGLKGWLSVQRLLHNRAQSDKLKAISMFTPDEVRYDSGIGMTHPVGSYGARYYEYGSTEIMSMGMQLFANPSHAAALFMKDPEMFYTILAAFRPATL